MGEYSALALIAALSSLLTLAVCLWIFRKVARIDVISMNAAHRLRSELDNNYAQLESLVALYRELELSGALPPTRGWAGSPDFLLQLARHVKKARPSTILECGSGTSTVVLARACQLNGQGTVFSLENDRRCAEATRENLERLGLSSRAKVIDAPLVEVREGTKSWRWYSLDQLPPLAIDMLVVDGPPERTSPLARYPALPQLYSRLSDGAVVFLDDYLRDDEKLIVEEWSARWADLQVSEANSEKGLAILTKLGSRNATGAAARGGPPKISSALVG